MGCVQLTMQYMSSTTLPICLLFLTIMLCFPTFPISIVCIGVKGKCSCAQSLCVYYRALEVYDLNIIFCIDVLFQIQSRGIMISHQQSSQCPIYSHKRYRQRKVMRNRSIAIVSICSQKAAEIKILYELAYFMQYFTQYDTQSFENKNICCRKNNSMLLFWHAKVIKIGCVYVEKKQWL